MPPLRSLLATAILLSLTGCVVPPRQVVVVSQPRPSVPRPVLEPVLASYPAIPPPRIEVVPAPPRPDLVVWEPGHWHWVGDHYDWFPGHYVERRAGFARWVPGHWDARPGGYAWIRAHWA